MTSLSLRRYTDLLIKWDITPNEFYALYILYKKDYEQIERYRSGTGNSLTEHILSLVDKQYVYNFNTDDNPYADLFIVTDQVADELFIDTREAGDEIIEIYPKQLHINGKAVPAITEDVEVLKEMYTRKIWNVREKHNDIKQKLKDQKEKGINMGLGKWIRSEQWKYDIDESNNYDETYEL